MAVSFLFPIPARGPEPCYWLASTPHESVLLTGTESRCYPRFSEKLD
jgi:hypothetical protein